MPVFKSKAIRPNFHKPKEDQGDQVGPILSVGARALDWGFGSSQALAESEGGLELLPSLPFPGGSWTPVDKCPSSQLTLPTNIRLHCCRFQSLCHLTQGQSQRYQAGHHHMCGF